MQALVDQFQGFFTVDQVKSTLVANKGDKPKTVNDLKFKQGKQSKGDFIALRSTSKEEQGQHQGYHLEES